MISILASIITDSVHWDAQLVQFGKERSAGLIDGGERWIGRSGLSPLAEDVAQPADGFHHADEFSGFLRFFLKRFECGIEPSHYLQDRLGAERFGLRQPNQGGAQGPVAGPGLFGEPDDLIWWDSQGDAPV